jgi:hypothetical protein
MRVHPKHPFMLFLDELRVACPCGYETGPFATEDELLEASENHFLETTFPKDVPEFLAQCEEARS